MGSSPIQSKLGISILAVYALWLAVGCQISFAQKYSVLTGTVLDSTTKRPVLDASVFVVGTKFGASTDSTGRYSFRFVTQDSQIVRISHVAYSPTWFFLPSSSRDTIVLNIMLSPAVVLLPAIISLGERFEERWTKFYFTAARAIISARQIEEDGIQYMQDEVNKRAPFLLSGVFRLWVDGMEYPSDALNTFSVYDVQNIYIWSGNWAPLQFKSGIGTPNFRSPRSAPVSRNTQYVVYIFLKHY